MRIHPRPGNSTNPNFVIADHSDRIDHAAASQPRPAREREGAAAALRIQGQKRLVRQTASQFRGLAAVWRAHANPNIPDLVIVNRGIVDLDREPQCHDRQPPNGC